MADYTLKSFVDDLDTITSTETDPAAITARAAPLLARLCRNAEALPFEYRTSPAGQRGRYMLHRAPRFTCIHFLSAIDNSGYFEADVSKINLFSDELVSESFRVGQDGCVPPQEKPGLGVDVDEVFLTAHPVIEGPGYV